jgi:hypothetical protein
VCFFADADYRFYLDRLVECAARYGVWIHGHVLINRGLFPDCFTLTRNNDELVLDD